MQRMLFPALVCLLVVVVGCGGSSSPTNEPSADPSSARPTPLPSVLRPSATPFATSTREPSPWPGTESLTEPFDASAFGANSARITNTWLPFTPGMHWVHEGSATVDGERIPRRVELTITDLEKTIGGVHAAVALELDYDRDKLVEAELAFWAQDQSGTVWHLGQYPEEYEEGKLVGTPVWLHGFEDANAGIGMKARPDVLGPSYSQGWGPAVGWTDRAMVFEVGSVTCVPVECYEDVLVINEFNRDEPDAHQLKYYVKDVGGVRVGWAGTLEEEREILELVSFSKLDAAKLADVRASALAQDNRGYTNSPDIYGKTQRAVPISGD
jgi:hypothetical protein